MKILYIPTLVVVLIGASGSELIAGAFSFNRVVDTSTPVPGRSVNFGSFGNGPPVLDGEDFAFIGQFSGGFGWYKYVGGTLTRVADSSTVIPGHPTNQTFDNFEASGISLSDGEMVFSGVRLGGGLFRGIYTDVGGVLHAVADANTTMPGTSQKFVLLLYPSIDNGNIVFAGRSGSNVRGIYTNLGGTLRAVDSNLSSQNHGRTAIDSGNIVFNFPQNSGIKAEIGGNLSTISTAGLDPAISGTNIVFSGSSFGSIQADFGAGVFTLFDQTTSIPGGSGTFSSFSSVSISGSTIAFAGSGPNSQQGIYTDIGGTLQKVIAVGDSIGGQTITQLSLSREALDGDKIAFAANFQGGGMAIYLATYAPVPEPGTAMLTACGVVLLSSTSVARNRRTTRR